MIDLVFNEGPNEYDHNFVEAEDGHGRSISVGGWFKREDGYWVLRITEMPAPAGQREMVHGDLYAGCSPDWVKDCYRWRGEVLLGQHAHWCPDWDYLPIDETTPEWPCPCA
jgi:hypothetical protein